MGACATKPGSAGKSGRRPLAALLLACLALVGQVLIAVLPVVVAATHDDPFLGPVIYCHAMPAGADGTSRQPAPGQHKTDCPLCFALQQLCSYVDLAGPAAAPPVRWIAVVLADAAPVDRSHHPDHQPQQPRAPPLLT